MIKTMKIVAANKPTGTITIRWNDDPELEWNYTVPLSDGTPLSGDDLNRWLVSESYSFIEEALQRRAADFAPLNGMIGLGHEDVSEIVSEFEELMNLDNPL